MILIPQQSNKKFSHPNSGDFFGNIKQTKNITFVKNGYISLEKRTRNIADSSVYTDLIDYSYENVVKMVSYNSSIWVTGGKSLYYFDVAFNFTKDVTANTPTIAGSWFDICIFNASSSYILCVADYSYSIISYYNGSSWSTFTTDVESAFVLCQFENKRALAVGGYKASISSPVVQLINADLVKSNILVLPPGYLIRSMAWNNNRLYIATLNNLGGDAIIYEWDGTSVEANNSYPVKAGVATAIVRYKTGVAFVTNTGQLMYLESAISELANLPIYYSNKVASDAYNNNLYYNSPVLHGGIVVDKDMIFIAVNAQYPRTIRDNQSSDFMENNYSSGVWCYDPEVGLYHRYSVGSSNRVTTGAITTANVNITTDIITIPSSIVPTTGTMAFYDDGAIGSGTKIAPLEFNKKYYVIKVSGTTLKLATTYSNALAGIAVDLTSTGNNSQTLIFCTSADFGGALERPAALFILIQNGTGISLPATSIATKLLIGSNVHIGNGSQIATINTPEALQENRGYFITPRCSSSGVTDNWHKVFLKFRPLITEEDKIIVKYRATKINKKYNFLYIGNQSATWVTSSTFTVTDITDIVVGDEVEIITGVGAGYLAHITNISALVGGVYTITIDEAVAGVVAGYIFDFLVDNWTKSPTIITSSFPTNSKGWAEIPIVIPATTIELKIELRGEDVAIEELQIISKPLKSE